VVVRVEVGDAGSAGELIQRLLEEVEAGEVSFEVASRRVCVDLGKDPDQAVARVLRTVEDWLVDLGGIGAKVEIDGRSYALEPPIPVGESQ
jgi:hypothetical protein